MAWLLEESTPAVRHPALGQFLGRPETDPDLAASLGAAMRTGPIAAILAHLQPDGSWVKPGAGVDPILLPWGRPAGLPPIDAGSQAPPT